MCARPRQEKVISNPFPSDEGNRVAPHRSPAGPTGAFRMEIRKCLYPSLGHTPHEQDLNSKPRHSHREAVQHPDQFSFSNCH